MKINLLWIGKTRNHALQSLVEEYEKRLRHYCDLSFLEIRPVQEHDQRRLVEREGEKILEKIGPGDFLVLLDSEGNSYDSKEFAKFIANFRDRNQSRLIFVIGGHAGVSSAVRKRANQAISLSRMTFNHEMIRAFLMEQIYRAFTLVHHLPYHK